jgi:uncharacterized ferritin-like protein (DUF455 family)
VWLATRRSSRLALHRKPSASPAHQFDIRFGPRQTCNRLHMDAARILDIILRNEIGHIAVGNRWYAWL